MISPVLASPSQALGKPLGKSLGKEQGVSAAAMMIFIM